MLVSPLSVRKRYYIFVVRHDWDGQLRRIPIPVHWVLVFVVCAVVGAGTLLGLAGSYTRLWTKARRLDDLREQQRTLVSQLASARQDAAQTRAEVASLGSLANEVAALYNLGRDVALRRSTQAADEDPAAVYNAGVEDFEALESSALNGNFLAKLSAGLWRPELWPVAGRISSSFGERLDPFDGEGAFHTGIDIATPIGTPVHVTADGVVLYAGLLRGYGRAIVVSHGHHLRTLYAHLSAFSTTAGQRVDRGDVIGFVGDSGRSTGPHLHYEVRINGVPVNPYQYLH